MQSNDSVAFGKKRSAASSPPFSLALVTPPNSHLENGHPVRYSGRMSTYCATAAPTRHPLGMAPSLPAPPPLMTAFGAPPMGVLACLGGAAARSPVFSRPIASSPVVPAVAPRVAPPSAATPTRTTTFDSCRQKRMRRHYATAGDTRRHQATRDATPRRRREPLATSGVPRQASFPVAKGSRPTQRLHRRRGEQLSIEPTWCPCLPIGSGPSCSSSVGRHGRLDGQGHFCRSTQRA